MATCGVFCLLALSARAIEPEPDVRITGETAADLFGWDVALAGDTDGDGHADFVIGAPANDAVDGFAGRAYLFRGPLERGQQLEAAEADAIVSAEAFGDNLGISVAGAGDVNNDGFADLVLGARGNDGAGIQAGRVYIFLGPLAGSLPAAQADAVISGEEFEELGRTVAGVGDLDSDGFDDVVLAAPVANVGGGFSGQVYVFLGPVAGELDSADADATIAGVLFNELLGTSIGSGDFNDDGVPDIVLGAPRPPLEGNDTGRAYIFFGPVEGAHSASEADVILMGEGLNDEFGSAVAGAGDTDGDGFEDLVVGAEQLFLGGGAGKAYLFRGPLAGTIPASEADAVLLGEAADDVFGTSVAGAGDVDGDGRTEVLVGAWDYSEGTRQGRAYRFHGPLEGTIPAAEADFIVTGEIADRLGLSVAGVGDLDGDGFAENLIGAPQFDEADPGYAALFFGGPSLLFADGFESGDTSAWSQAVP